MCHTHWMIPLQRTRVHVCPVINSTPHYVTGNQSKCRKRRNPPIGELDFNDKEKGPQRGAEETMQCYQNDKVPELSYREIDINHNFT